MRSIPAIPASTKRLSSSRRTALLKALADPRRFEVLERVAKSSCPITCSDVLSAIPIAPATMSHHIKELEAAGLIDARREGKFMYLSLRAGVLEGLASSLRLLETAGCPKSPATSSGN